ncbi:putative 2-oxoglutarate-dependent dioxygenase [Cardamine amara subsp. amara]|uniref:2-oxoglutarate-dependent dioxygenase n=1 Tax=Cardamine amara subsp. amara TaxID=228776 RepID=A0ABD1BX04_CARAN
MEEASTIKDSSLTCIDLANSNLHQSAVLLKQACLYFFLLYIKDDYDVIIITNYVETLNGSLLFLFQACLDSGFFYVINHGISEELKEEAFGQSKKFFALPLEEKMKVLRNAMNRGYSPFLDQMLDPENQVHGDYKESFFIGFEDVLPGWRETMEKYHQEALRVCKAIARILALALNLDADYFDTPSILGNPSTVMRLAHYEGMSDPSEGIYGCGAHSDFGMMTLLATDSVMGLQVLHSDVKPRKWEYVPSIKGAYIVNLGDLLERWTNGIFKSTLHRVLGNGQDRYSIPLFVQPSDDCLVKCLPTCQSEDNY